MWAELLAAAFTGLVMFMLGYAKGFMDCLAQRHRGGESGGVAATVSRTPESAGVAEPPGLATGGEALSDVSRGSRGPGRGGAP